jgi:hypothetical protein
MLITVLAEKLDDTVSQADARRLICHKDHKFLEFLAVLFIQNFVQDITHDESLTRLKRKHQITSTKLQINSK